MRGVCMCAGEQASVFIHASLSFSFLFFFFFLFCRTTLFSVISICCDKAASSFSRNGPLQIMSVIPNRGAKADFAPPPRPFSLQPPLILPRYHSRHRLLRNADERGRMLSVRAALRQLTRAKANTLSASFPQRRRRGLD